MKLNTLLTGIGLFLMLALTGCGGSNPATTIPPTTPVVVAPSVITGIMPWDDVTKLPADKKLFMLANRKGFEVKPEEITLNSAYLSGLVQTMVLKDVLPVGQGFSGSPIIDENGKLLGACYAGNNGDAFSFYGKGIENMLEDQQSELTQTRAISSKNTTTWEASGSSEAFFNLIKNKVEASKKSDLNMKFVSKTSSRSATRGSFQAQPGATIAVRLMSGPVMNIDAYGTLTHSISADGKVFDAFGHRLDQVGASNLPVSPAYVDNIVTAGFEVYKDCHSVGASNGTLVYDSLHKVVVDFKKVPATTPVITNITFNGNTKSYTHQLSRYKGNYYELMALNSGLLSPLSLLNNENGSWMATAKLTYQIEGEESETIDFVIPDEFMAKGMSRGGPSTNGVKTIGDLRNQIDSLVYNETANANIEGKSFISAQLNVEIKPYEEPLPEVVPVPEFAPENVIISDLTAVKSADERNIEFSGTIVNTGSEITQAVITVWDSSQEAGYIAGTPKKVRVKVKTATNTYSKEYFDSINAKRQLSNVSVDYYGDLDILTPDQIKSDWYNIPLSQNIVATIKFTYRM